MEEEDIGGDEPRRAFLLVLRNASAADMQSILATLRECESLIVENDEYDDKDSDEEAGDIEGQFEIEQLRDWRRIPPPEKPEDWTTDEPDEEE